jgi:lipopolysaccharide/colanic/teichoic acid biosynthesis glycosyltransferase
MAFVAVRSRLLAWPAYFVAGNTASLMGIIGYVCGSQVSTMQMVARTKPVHHHSAVEFGKRLFDLALGLTALIPLGLLFIPLALAIRLESPGPIFYRQLRVGRAWPDRTDLIQVWKFRSMRADAERQTGAVLAGRDDPRITRVGRFIRKTRLDELPQAINVVRGEMSIVGPRPERPAFFPRLEAEIPFYSERVFALKPGITGLAQVNQGYDETLDDVRNKVLLDHSYALRIGSLGNWLRTDLAIIGRTVLVMVMGKGR